MLKLTKRCLMFTDGNSLSLDIGECLKRQV